MKEGWNGGVIGNANISIKQVGLIGSNPAIELSYNFPIGNKINIDQNSSLVRPFTKLIEDGKPAGKINFLFFQEKNEYYILGSFANTGRRIVFFPGIIARKITTSPPDSDLLTKHAVHLDHLTLEENWRNWHIKLLSQNKDLRLKKRNTKRFGDTLFLWFVVAVKSLDKLEIAPKSQSITIQGPHQNELKRRLKELLKARDGSVFYISKLEHYPEEQWYLNIEFFINGKPANKDLGQVPLSTARHLSDVVNGTTNRGRETPVALNQFPGLVWVRVTKMPGTLQEDILFIQGKDFDGEVTSL